MRTALIRSSQDFRKNEPLKNCEIIFVTDSGGGQIGSGSDQLLQAAIEMFSVSDCRSTVGQFNATTMVYYGISFIKWIFIYSRWPDGQYRYWHCFLIWLDLRWLWQWTLWLMSRQVWNLVIVYNFALDFLIIHRLQVIREARWSAIPETGHGPSMESFRSEKVSEVTQKQHSQKIRTCTASKYFR